LLTVTLLFLTDSVTVTMTVSRVDPPTRNLEQLYTIIIETYNSSLQKARNLSQSESDVCSSLDECDQDRIQSLLLVNGMLDIFANKGVHPSSSNQDNLQITFKCDSEESYYMLLVMYDSGLLLKILQNGFITNYVLLKCNVKSITLNISRFDNGYIPNFRNTGMFLSNVLNHLYICRVLLSSLLLL